MKTSPILAAALALSAANLAHAEIKQAAADGFVRYYKAPGVAHCLAGPGADTADLLSALDTWAGGGAAPATLTALKLDPTNGTTLFSRPLCVHPKYPRYNGRGDVNAAASYTCT